MVRYPLTAVCRLTSVGERARMADSISIAPRRSEAVAGATGAALWGVSAGALVDRGRRALEGAGACDHRRALRGGGAHADRPPGGVVEIGQVGAIAGVGRARRVAAAA